jgi:hypothetical protein
MRPPAQYRTLRPTVQFSASLRSLPSCTGTYRCYGSPMLKMFGTDEPFQISQAVQVKISVSPADR